MSGGWSRIEREALSGPGTGCWYGFVAMFIAMALLVVVVGLMLPDSVVRGQQNVTEKSRG